MPDPITPELALKVIDALVGAGVPPYDLLELADPENYHGLILAAEHLNHTKTPVMPVDALTPTVCDFVRHMDDVTVILAFAKEGTGVVCILAVQRQGRMENNSRYLWADREVSVVVRELRHHFSEQSDLTCLFGLHLLVISPKSSRT